MYNFHYWCIMLDNIIQWFNAFQSRYFVVLVYVLMFAYVEIAIMVKNKEIEQKKEAKRNKKNKRFVYCVGKKSNIAYVDLVTEFEYDNLLERDENGSYHEISYAIIDRNTSSTYFLLP